MRGSSSGLCSTCDYDLSCAFRGNVDVPVHHCEEFVADSSVPPVFEVNVGSISRAKNVTPDHVVAVAH